MPGKRRTSAVWRGLLLALLLGVLSRGAAGGTGDFDPAAVWGGRCSTCHTVGQGQRIGPDLEGVSARRTEAWLIAFIRSSQALIESEDAIAVGLFDRYGEQRMPDHDYSPEEIRRLLAYIAAGGPGEPESLFRPAAEATEEEIAIGRDFFFGARSALPTGAACASCHTVEPSPSSRRFLGGSLAQVYSKYHDVELAKLLEGVTTTPLMESLRHPSVAPGPSFALRAFLRRVDETGGETVETVDAYASLGLGAGTVLVVLCGFLERRRSPSRNSKPGG